jgi:hypothetical protein
LGSGFFVLWHVWAHGLRNPLQRFDKSDFSKKSDLLGSGFFVLFLARLGTRFEKSDFYKGLRNPIFPKNLLGHFLGGLETSAFLH